MTELIKNLLGEIETKLNTCWMARRMLAINAKVEEIKSIDGKSQVARFLERSKLEAEENSKFSACWEGKVKQQLDTKAQALYQLVEAQLLKRHPWLNEEKKSTESASSLKEIFLKKAVSSLLFDLLENKPPGAKTWEDIVISADVEFSWAKVDEVKLSNQIQGYPLSDAAFYDERALPSFLESPFTLPPTRYDLYRFLKNTYKAKFTPINTSKDPKDPNPIFCTKIAPMHHSELATLSAAEWNTIETILVNVGKEEDPKWVLLDNRKGSKTFYIPDFWDQENLNLPNVGSCEVKKVTHSPNPKNWSDWHAILLGRVLPWTQLTPNIPMLKNYRESIPISLLWQDMLEASCLPLQKKYKDAARKAFARRYPLSAVEANKLYLTQQAPECLFPNIPEPSAETIIKAFDASEIIYDPLKSQLTINTKEKFIEAMQIAYFEGVKKLVINVEPKEEAKQWFEYNLDYEKSDALSAPEYEYIHACAARNRFLAAEKPNYLKDATDAKKARQQAWEKTGQFIYEFFQNAVPADAKELKHIAEMGREGLKVFFSYLEKLPTNHNLSCTFNLDSGLTCKAKDYMQLLAEKIQAFAKKPLFSKLSLILPPKLDEATIEAFQKLIGAISKDGAVKEIELCNKEAITKEFLDALINFAKDKNLCLLIKIPEWDEEAFADPKQGSLKAKYRELQNTILNNRRLACERELEINTASIDKPLPVAYPLKHQQRQVAEDKSWLTGVMHPLVFVTTGVQQQAQQEVAQEVQQEVDQQSEPKGPPTREILPYKGDESKLITRANLNTYNISSADFSTWVGGNEDALFLIQKMDVAALTQIRKFPHLYKFGIDGERTPGFRLYYSAHPEKALILTFDESLVEQDIEDLKLDPFATQFNSSKPATAFYGDYRQLAPIDSSDPITLWHHLATENVPPRVQEWLQDNACDTKTSESLQYLNVEQEIARAKDKDELIAILKTWSKIEDEQFFRALFALLTPLNLKAFGQLFYHYGIKGNTNWLSLVHKLYVSFPEHFAIYKKRLLDPFNDWSECLEKEEVEALTNSMQKLAKFKVYQDILWTLIDTHGKNVGRMRFAEVWRAYDMVIDYINAHDLKINQKEFIAAISKYQDEFNATQFLRRIYRVLQQTGMRQDSQANQQEILNNLSKIDWRENGFYYACVNENYRYWDEALMLQDMNSLGQKSQGYTARWDAVDLNTITNPATYALRFAAQQLKLSKNDFNKFKAIIMQVATDCADNKALIMRIITASIALGVDTIDNLANIDWKQFAGKDKAHSLEIINQTLCLDAKEKTRQSYHVRLQDLNVLLEVLKKTDLSPDLNTINALGRALACYKEDKAAKLTKLIDYGKKHGFTDPLVTAFPWLVDDPIEGSFTNEEHIKFYKQLSSIDFARSTLPEKKTLTQILASIRTPQDRHTAVNKLIRSNCFIVDCDTDFRVLEPAETKLIDDFYLAKTFQAQNHMLLKKLSLHLAIKQEGNTQEKIQTLLKLFKELDRKNYYDELGQLLGLLLEHCQNGEYFAIEQLTTWLTAVFDENEFKTKPYPVSFIKALLTDALQDKDSSLLNKDLDKLKVKEENPAKAQKFEVLKTLIRQINLKDLHNQAKLTIVKCAIKFKHEANLANIIASFDKMFTQLKAFPHVTAALCEYLGTQLELSPDDLLASLNLLEKLTTSCPVAEEKLKVLWGKNQIKLLEGLKLGAISSESLKLLMNIDPLNQMIVVAALTKGDTAELIAQVNQELSRLSKAFKIELANYYTTDPKPTLAELHLLLKKQKNPEVLKDYFEREMVAQNKRDYSLSDEDAIAIKRVLGGFKLKKRAEIAPKEQAELLNLLYYLNTYSCTMKLEEKSLPELLELIKTNKNQNSQEAKARVLACMREVLVRKTGKWVNRTQMIALLYSVLHNDDNILHQIRMGEGKSIISLMRVAYRALNGQLVDVYSSKESLSLRDHEEALAVLDALKIPNGHITAKSSIDQYHTQVNEDGVGAVHYAIIGNWSLFLSGIRWDNKDAKSPIDINADNRVAFLDEGDYIMRSENTLFNFSDQAGAASIYNYDAWVYQVVYDFYLKNKEKFARQDYRVSETEDLQELYLKLQESAQTVAPEKSTYFQKYLASSDENLRNQKLVSLLSAAHLAHNLEEGIDFSVMPEPKKIDDKTSIETHFAKVMINNQIYHGSTYSDLVQQFLHTRLNHEAIEANKTPDFFIEPESEIAISLSAPYILKHYYKHLEACTGTAGDDEALAFYKDEFAIDYVTKLPTDKEIKTEFLPPVYCKDEETQIEQIVASIRKNKEQPILITCEDDKAVEHLGNLLKKALPDKNMVIDTNATGISEADILKNAGKNGAITISSRLGRGSDIRPANPDLGLGVIRTYPAIPEVVKQEQGRQGRQGQVGVCQDILNYAAIKKDLDKYKDDEQFNKFLERETLHLEAKLAKPRQQDKKIWTEIRENASLKEQYLHTRALQRLKRNLKEESKRRMLARDNLIIEGSGQVMWQLPQVPISQRAAFKEDWLKCRKYLETHWTDEDSLREARTQLHAFYAKYQIEPPEPFKRSNRALLRIIPSSDAVALDETILFYQKWLNGILEGSLKFDLAAITALYGEDGKYLDELYQAFKKLNKDQLATFTQLATKNPLCHSISCEAWAKAIDILINNEDAANCLERFTAFFAKSLKAPKNAEEINILSRNFLAAIEGVPNVEFLTEIIEAMDKDKTRLLGIVQRFPKQVVDLCRTCMSKEDIVFFLNALSKSSEAEVTALLSYMVQHHTELKTHPATIRPLIPLLLQNQAQVIFQNLQYGANTAALLSFLSKRPYFTEQDYQDLDAKINRLQEEDKPKFLEYLSMIPPNISVRSVLQALVFLPGKYSFIAGAKELEARIEQIHVAATAFNNFLFDHNVIVNKYWFDLPKDKEQYHTWNNIFAKFSLEEQEKFFVAVKELSHIELTQLETLANSYYLHKDPKTLQTEINELAQQDMNLAQRQADSPPAGGGVFFRRQI